MVATGLPLPGTSNVPTGFPNNYVSAGCTNYGNITKTPRTVYNNMYFKISNLRLRELLARGPTANEIMTNGDFRSFTGSSVYTCSYTAYQDSDLDSAIIIMGYTSGGQWIVRWFNGVAWGDRGYMLLKMDQKDCGIRRRVYQISTVNWSGHCLFSMLLAILLMFV